MSTMEKQNTSRTRRSFTEEFKADAVAMVLDDGRRIVDVAEAIGVGEGTLGNWVRLEKIERGERAGLTRDDRSELVELRKENARLRMERDLLKRATAYVGDRGQEVTGVQPDWGSSSRLRRPSKIFSRPTWPLVRASSRWRRRVGLNSTVVTKNVHDSQIDSKWQSISTGRAQ